MRPADHAAPQFQGVPVLGRASVNVYNRTMHYDDLEVVAQLGQGR